MHEKENKRRVVSGVMWILQFALLCCIFIFLSRFMERYKIFREIYILKITVLFCVTALYLFVWNRNFGSRAYRTTPNKADPVISETNCGGVGRFYIGMTRDEVNTTINTLKRSKDKYEDVEETRNEITKIYRSPYFVFAFDSQERLVYISTNQNVYSTPLGLTSGDSIKCMKDLYGHNYLHYSDAGSESALYEYKTAENYLDIMIKDNKVLWWGLSKNEIGEFAITRALDFVKERSFSRGKKWAWHALPRYMKKPHYCPECNSRMEAKKVERVVSSKSPEARNFDFSSVDGYLIGLIKFTWDEFHCPQCDNQLTVPEMKKYEK